MTPTDCCEGSREISDQASLVRGVEICDGRARCPSRGVIPCRILTSATGVIMKATAHLLLCLGLAACHYTGSVEPFGYEGHPAHQKIDAVVAYRSSSSKVQALQLSATFSSYELNVGTAVDKAIMDILGNRFREVRQFPCEGAAILFEPACVIPVRSFDAWSGNVGIDVKLKLLAIDLATGEVGEVFEVAEPMNYSPPGTSMLLGFLTGASLFLLSPITMPLDAYVNGRKAIGDLRGTLMRMMRVLDEEMESKKARLAGLASSMTPDEVQEHSPAVPSPPSRYDAILDCVAGVKSRKGMGSGFFISSSGHLLTNNHVVEGDLQPTIRLRSGATVLGKVVSRDMALDLAVIETGLTKTAWLPLAAREELEVGEDVIAVGTPKGLEWSVTKGIISATGRGKGGALLQTDAAINTGNSGGPLVSTRTGKVVGISTLILRGVGAEGLGFAVCAPLVADACKLYLPKER